MRVIIFRFSKLCLTTNLKLKEFLKKIYRKVLAWSFGMMALFTKVAIIWARNMGMACISGLTVLSSMVTGNLMKCMGKELFPGLTEENTKARSDQV